MAAQLQAFIRSMIELRTPHRQCCVCVTVSRHWTTEAWRPWSRWNADPLSLSKSFCWILVCKMPAS